jgi:hypothetical protein
MRSTPILASVLAFSLVGCAAGTASFVPATLSSSDNQVMADAITDYLGSALPPARTTLAVEPAISGNQAFLAQISTDLRARGFGIADAKTADARFPRLRLLVSPIWSGYVVRIDYAGQEASTYFARDTSGALQANIAFVHREITQ